MKSLEEKPILISVVGPTAVGKTRVAIELAKYFNTEILSCDSRQFFKELEIGTAKPSSKELTEVTHHFINNLSIHEEYSAGQFERDALMLLEKYFQKRAVMVMVGGSGLYCQALWKGIDQMPAIDPAIRDTLNKQFQAEGIDSLQKELAKKDPEYYAMVDLQNHSRLIRALEVIRSSGDTYSSYRLKNQTASERPFRMINIGLAMEKEILYERIDNRMDQMIATGLFEEARKFYEFQHHNALRTVGYQEIFAYLDGVYDKEEAIRLLKRNSRRYAKRQLTWFKKDQSIRWFDMTNPNYGLNQLIQFLKQEIS